MSQSKFEALKISQKKAAIKQEILPHIQPLIKPTRDRSIQNRTTSLNLKQEAITYNLFYQRKIQELQRELQNFQFQHQANLVYNKQFKTLGRLFGNENMEFQEIKQKIQDRILNAEQKAIGSNHSYLSFSNHSEKNNANSNDFLPELLQLSKQQLKDKLIQSSRSEFLSILELGSALVLENESSQQRKRKSIRQKFYQIWRQILTNSQEVTYKLHHIQSEYEEDLKRKQSKISSSSELLQKNRHILQLAEQLQRLNKICVEKESKTSIYKTNYQTLQKEYEEMVEKYKTLYTQFDESKKMLLNISQKLYGYEERQENQQKIVREHIAEKDLLKREIEELRRQKENQCKQMIKKIEDLMVEVGKYDQTIIDMENEKNEVLRQLWLSKAVGQQLENKIKDLQQKSRIDLQRHVQQINALRQKEEMSKRYDVQNQRRIQDLNQQLISLRQQNDVQEKQQRLIIEKIQNEKYQLEQQIQHIQREYQAIRDRLSYQAEPHTAQFGVGGNNLTEDMRTSIIENRAAQLQEKMSIQRERAYMQKAKLQRELGELELRYKSQVSQIQEKYCHHIRDLESYTESIKSALANNELTILKQDEEIKKWKQEKENGTLQFEKLKKYVGQVQNNLRHIKSLEQQAKRQGQKLIFEINRLSLQKQQFQAYYQNQLTQNELLKKQLNNQVQYSETQSKISQIQQLREKFRLMQARQKQYQAALENGQRDYYSLLQDYKSLSISNSELVDKIKSLQQEMSRIVSRQSEKQNQLNKIINERNKAIEELNILFLKNSEKLQEATSNKSLQTIPYSNIEQEASRTQCLQLQTQCKALQNINSQLQHQIDRLEQQREEIKKLNKNSGIESHSHQSTNYQQIIDEYKETLKEWQSRISHLQSQIIQKQKFLKQKQGAICELKNTVENQSRQLKKHAHDKGSNDLSMHANIAQSDQEKNQKLNQQLTDTLQELNTLKNYVSALKQQIGSVKQLNQSLRSQNNSLKQINRVLKEQNQSLIHSREQLESEKKQMLRTIYVLREENIKISNQQIETSINKIVSSSSIKKIDTKISTQNQAFDEKGQLKTIKQATDSQLEIEEDENAQNGYLDFDSKQKNQLQSQSSLSQIRSDQSRIEQPAQTGYFMAFSDINKNESDVDLRQNQAFRSKINYQEEKRLRNFDSIIKEGEESLQYQFSPRLSIKKHSTKYDAYLRESTEVKPITINQYLGQSSLSQNALNRSFGNRNEVSSQDQTLIESINKINNGNNRIVNNEEGRENMQTQSANKRVSRDSRRSSAGRDLQKDDQIQCNKEDIMNRLDDEKEDTQRKSFDLLKKQVNAKSYSQQDLHNSIQFSEKLNQTQKYIEMSPLSNRKVQVNERGSKPVAKQEERSRIKSSQKNDESESISKNTSNLNYSASDAEQSIKGNNHQISQQNNFSFVKKQIVLDGKINSQRLISQQLENIQDVSKSEKHIHSNSNIEKSVFNRRNQSDHIQYEPTYAQPSEVTDQSSQEQLKYRLYQYNPSENDNSSVQKTIIVQHGQKNIETNMKQKNIHSSQFQVQQSKIFNFEQKSKEQDQKSNNKQQFKAPQLLMQLLNQRQQERSQSKSMSEEFPKNQISSFDRNKGNFDASIEHQSPLSKIIQQSGNKNIFTNNLYLEDYKKSIEIKREGEYLQTPEKRSQRQIDSRSEASRQQMRTSNQTLPIISMKQSALNEPANPQPYPNISQFINQNYQKNRYGPNVISAESETTFRHISNYTQQQIFPSKKSVSLKLQQQQQAYNHQIPSNISTVRQSLKSIEKHKYPIEKIQTEGIFHPPSSLTQSPPKILSNQKIVGPITQIISSRYPSPSKVVLVEKIEKNGYFIRQPQHLVSIPNFSNTPSSNNMNKNSMPSIGAINYPFNSQPNDSSQRSISPSNSIKVIPLSQPTIIGYSSKLIQSPSPERRGEEIRNPYYLSSPSSINKMGITFNPGSINRESIYIEKLDEKNSQEQHISENRSSRPPSNRIELSPAPNLGIIKNSRSQNPFQSIRNSEIQHEQTKLNIKKATELREKNDIGTDSLNHLKQSNVSKKMGFKIKTEEKEKNEQPKIPPQVISNRPTSNVQHLMSPPRVVTNKKLVNPSTVILSSPTYGQKPKQIKFNPSSSRNSNNQGDYKFTSKPYLHQQKQEKQTIRIEKKNEKELSKKIQAQQQVFNSKYKQVDGLSDSQSSGIDIQQKDILDPCCPNC